ncbi:PadR family transcriptional regulator [Micromonospora sp. BRA006-A]|nr:PadR family transcriptional regulator [Micromonospora sp. BRA006-A]
MMILGLVRWMQPVHGYDVRRELLSWSADKWANVQPGSIYHALRKLTDEGLLRTVSVEQVGARPARTTYEVTPKGEDEFETLLRAQWWQVQETPDPFVAAFSFLPAMPATRPRRRCATGRTCSGPGWSRCGPRSTRTGYAPASRCTSGGCSSWAGPRRGGDGLVRADRGADRVGSLVPARWDGTGRGLVGLVRRVSMTRHNQR